MATTDAASTSSGQAGVGAGWTVADSAALGEVQEAFAKQLDVLGCYTVRPEPGIDQISKSFPPSLIINKYAKTY